MTSSCLLLLSIKSNLSALPPLQKIAHFKLTATHYDGCLCLSAYSQLSLMFDETSHYTSLSTNIKNISLVKSQFKFNSQHTDLMN